MRLLAQIGNYKLERELGRGASSEVWLGRHTQLPDLVVAVKILVSQERETVRRFEREAAIASRLRHPNIARTLDYGYLQPFHYTVLEYIEGSSLRQMLARRRRLPFAEAITIFTHLASALDYAHGLSIIHRDLSTANILVEERTGRTLLTDFGIARDANEPITVVHSFMGTPGYLSPEHLKSATSVSRSSDIFGLGIILYQMLSGELPWPATPENPSFSAPLLPLRARGVEGLPADVDRVLNTLLALDPTKRYPSAGAAATDLRRIAQRHTVETQVRFGTAPVAGKAFVVQSNGIEADQITTILGPQLVRTVLERTHLRAEALRDPTAVAALLDGWSAQAPLFRRAFLGRLAQLHKLSSRNVYFYQLRVLYEQRIAAEDAEEPDRKAEVFPLEPELERWAVILPPAEHFTDEAGGQLNLPGSTRVVICKDCKGKGATVCPSCHGQQRVVVTRPAPPVPEGPTVPPVLTATTRTVRRATAPVAPARNTTPEQVIVPCADCGGRGGLTCGRCTGIGRLVQRKTFHWSREAELLTTQDDLPALNERWLARTCKAEPIYCQRQRGGVRPEWAHLDAVAPLLETVTARCDDTTRVVLSELAISLIPITEVVFDLGKTGDGDLYKLAIYGFEQRIPPDWRFFNWERVLFSSLVAFLSIIVLILLVATFSLGPPLR